MLVNDTLLVLIIVAISVISGVISIHFLIKGLKENIMLHTALAGNTLIITSTISAICLVLL